MTIVFYTLNFAIYTFLRAILRSVHFTLNYVYITRNTLQGQRLSLVQTVDYALKYSWQKQRSHKRGNKRSKSMYASGMAWNSEDSSGWSGCFCSRPRFTARDLKNTSTKSYSRRFDDHTKEACREHIGSSTGSTESTFLPGVFSQFPPLPSFLLNESLPCAYTRTFHLGIDTSQRPLRALGIFRPVSETRHSWST